MKCAVAHAACPCVSPNKQPSAVSGSIKGKGSEISLGSRFRSRSSELKAITTALPVSISKMGTLDAGFGEDSSGGFEAELSSYGNRGKVLGPVVWTEIYF